jgi:hypothetical protein
VTTTEITTTKTAELDDYAQRIDHEVTMAERNYKDAVQHAINAGELLTEVKARLKHGQWQPWLAANFPGSATTARNYMRLAANQQRVAVLPTVREAVALLSEPKPASDGFKGDDRPMPDHPLVHAADAELGRWYREWLKYAGIKEVLAESDHGQPRVDRTALEDLQEGCRMADAIRALERGLAQ